jgi:hypothetical protein
MKNSLITLSAAAAFLIAACPAFSQPADSLASGAAALGFQLPGGELPAVALPGIPARARAFQPAANVLPENCLNMPMLYVKNGDLYKNGKKLGGNASSYKGACSGDAAWRDSYGRIYKNEAELGSSAQNFEIALYTGDVFWKNSYGRLYKNSSEVGSAQVFIIADWTGDVAWRDSYGNLYKNSEKLGDSGRFQMAGHTGDVVWVNNFGTLYKNREELGRSNNFFVADRTGDVAWLDGFSNLYLNKTRVSTSCQRFELREDGKLLWVDNFGEYHYVDAAGRFIPALDAASAASRGTVLLLDPRTGKVQPAIQVGGGFIWAATGQFVPAVFNGSGYILPSGQYLPVVGGRAANPESSLTGKWTGWGEWTYQGSGTRCDVMWLAFEDGKDYLERKDGYFDCGFVGLASEPARWTKKGSQLLDQNGAEAGSYEKGNVVLKEAYSENVDILTTIKVDGLHFDYSEIWTEKNGRELYVITGRMFTGGR